MTAITAQQQAVLYLLFIGRPVVPPPEEGNITMIAKTPNRQMIASSLSRSSAHGALGHDGAGAPGRISRLRAGILPLLGVAIGEIMSILAAAWN